MLPEFNQCCRELMCLAQGHNTMTPVGIKPRTSLLELDTIPLRHSAPFDICTLISQIKDFITAIQLKMLNDHCLCFHTDYSKAGFPITLPL